MQSFYDAVVVVFYALSMIRLPKLDYMMTHRMVDGSLAVVAPLWRKHDGKSMML